MRMLVVAKAPVAGEAKTRLGVDIGSQAAAEVAAAALLDTLAACEEAVGRRRCHLALAGDLAGAARGTEIAAALARWSVFPQRGSDFAERLVNAHRDAGDGVVVQVGMDTPHATSDQLQTAAHALEGHDVVLGPAEDGGWWVLARRTRSAVLPLLGVAMSTPTTYDDTRAALLAADLTVATTARMRDVDTVEDAGAVAVAAPTTRFAAVWTRLQNDR
jgi:glycosyltransferase A (GT-A) superfamily protein (DUF2064 family)